LFDWCSDVAVGAAAFLSFRSLKEVVGVELCHSRYLIAEQAALQLASNFPDEFSVVDWVRGCSVTVATLAQVRCFAVCAAPSLV